MPARAIDVAVDTRNAAASGPFSVYVFRSTQGGIFSPLWTAVQLPKDFRTMLAPDEVLFLDLRPAGGGDGGL